MDKDLGFPVFSRGGAIKDIELPPLSKFDHPEPRTMQWSDLELYAIKSYARAAVEADRAQRVPDVAEIRRVLACVKSSVDSGIPVTDGWRILDALLASTPAPAQQEPARGTEIGDPSEAELRLQNSAAETHAVMGIAMQALAAQHQWPPQQERKPMTGEEVIEGLSEIGVTVWGPRSEDFERGVRFAERHHGIKE